jgi:hypothetical protein
MKRVHTDAELRRELVLRQLHYTLIDTSSLRPFCLNRSQ